MSISLHPDTSQERTLAASSEPEADAPAVQAAPAPKVRARLFAKYVALFVAVVTVALLSNRNSRGFFYYREQKSGSVTTAQVFMKEKMINPFFTSPAPASYRASGLVL